MNGLFSRMEVLVAGVLILVFLFRAASRCKETKVGLQGETPAQTIADSVIVKRDGEKTYTGEKDLLAEALRKKKKELAAQKAAAQKDSLRKTAGDSLRQTTAA
ncbi:MAG TPA: hypothetical protein ENJ20_03775, partial [Bacteroidetes bacterium]|nr:hypothetical protein [Bacteroidota bacterium]